MIKKILSINKFITPSLAQLNSYLYRYKWKYMAGFLFIILSNLMMIIGVEYTRKAISSIEKIYSNQSTETDNLLFYALVIVFSPLISGFLTFMMRQTIIIGSRKIEFDLKNDVFKKYQTLSQNFYKQHRTGDLMARISEDVLQARMYLGPGIMYTLNLLVLSVMITTQMISIDPVLSLYVLIPLPFLSIIIYTLSKVINKKSVQVQVQLSAISSFVQDSFSGIRVIKSFNVESKNINDYEQEIKSFKKKNLNLAKVNAFFYPTVLLIIGLTYLLILYIGGKRYLNGDISEIGTIVAFFLYINYLIWPFTMVGWVTSVIQRAEASQQRINEFLNEEDQIPNYSDQENIIEGEIEFKNVSFTYQNTKIQALQNVSFHLKNGDTLAILGSTASGKTTLAEVLMRMYEIDSGDILIDQKPIKKHNLFSLRNNIGYVPQDSFLFSDTIADNIAFGIDNATPEKIIEAAKKAVVHDNIMQFSNGYETKLGERGVTLSGGQKQRVSIARALIKEPKIYIFDDSLSAVDTETEEEILNNLKNSTSQTTTLIITHRISSAKNADQILVLEKGEVVQIGTHESLILEEGYYKNLYEQQINTDLF